MANKKEQPQQPQQQPVKPTEKPRIIPTVTPEKLEQLNEGVEISHKENIKSKHGK